MFHQMATFSMILSDSNPLSSPPFFTYWVFLYMSRTAEATVFRFCTQVGHI